MTENYLLEVKNVSKSFGVVKALNRIDFNVRPNEIHALCGENGAGKSTLMEYPQRCLSVWELWRRGLLRRRTLQIPECP
ncbi:MAG: ATP-binding cassette domain-containing protein [Christensenellales bacterium]